MLGALVSFTATVAGGSLYYAQTKSFKLRLQWLGSDFGIGAMLAASLFCLIGAPLIQHLNSGESYFAHLIVFGSMLGFAFSGLLKRALKTFSKFSEADLGKFLFLAVLAFYQIPEGLASGVADASHSHGLLSVIALQDLPEGFLFAAMLIGLGFSSRIAFLGVLGTGLIESAAALSASAVIAHDPSWLPLLKGFAGGAMLYVTASELGAKLFDETELSLATKPFAIGIASTLILQAIG